MRVLGLIIFICGMAANASAQELNCRVSIITDARLELNNTDPAIMKEMEQSIFDFMNNTQWTKDHFEVDERINCNVQLQVNEIPEQGTFNGSLQIQVSRPAFNSSYNTVIFNFQDDDISFKYARGAVLVYSPKIYTNELTSVLAFYAYFILGMDYDSFSLKGGTKYFTEAQMIATNAQSSGGTGWSPSAKGKNNRYWLVDNILHQLFEPLRECNYEYHRKGIDKLYDDMPGGRKAIYDALSKLIKVTATRPNSINLLNFVQSKSTELKNLYSEADVKEKNDIVSLLKRIDPANSSKYQQILE